MFWQRKGYLITGSKDHYGDLVTETGSEDGGREAALELPSDWGVEAKAGRIYLSALTQETTDNVWASSVYEICVWESYSMKQLRFTNLVIFRWGRCARRKCKTGSCHFTWWRVLDKFVAMLSSEHKDTDHLAKDKSKGHKGKRDKEKEGVGILHQGQPVRVSRHLMQKKCSKQICNGEPLPWR